MLKLKLNKLISKGKKEIKRTLLYGKLLSQLNLNGRHLGVKGVQAGTLNVRLWLILSLAIKWIFILEVLI